MTDNNTVADIVTSEATTVTVGTAEPIWYIDDKTPGQGERPDWMPSQFKRASDIGKSYTELQKKLGGFTGAPEKYDFTSLEIDETDPIVQMIAEVGKEKGMNQDTVNTLLGRMISLEEAQKAMTIDEEIKKLGPDGERILNEYKNWQKDYFKPEETEVVSSWIKTADDLKVFNRIMSNTNMSAVPTTQSMAMANNYETISSLKAELVTNVDRYDTDPAYRKEWSTRMHRAAQRDRS